MHTLPRAAIAVVVGCANTFILFLFGSCVTAPVGFFVGKRLEILLGLTLIQLVPILVYDKLTRRWPSPPSQCRCRSCHGILQNLVEPCCPYCGEHI